MVIIETEIFTGLVAELMDDDEYSRLQKYMVENPKAGMSFKKRAASGSSAGVTTGKVNGAGFASFTNTPMHFTSSGCC